MKRGLQGAAPQSRPEGCPSHPVTAYQCAGCCWLLRPVLATQPIHLSRELSAVHSSPVTRREFLQRGSDNQWDQRKVGFRTGGAGGSPTARGCSCRQAVERQ